ncbi:MAG: VOC family protein [Oscillospiraceae bacterium]|nr:VOC family protein [Oscillospiraceae bacterium]
MRIDHAALWVGDLERAKDFFIRYFGAAANEKYQNPRTGFCSYFLSFEEGAARLELMSGPAAESGVRGAGAGYAHLALGAGSRERVDELTERLRRDGFQVLSGPRVTGDGCYESCVEDAEGNQIEITV